MRLRRKAEIRGGAASCEVITNAKKHGNRWYASKKVCLHIAAGQDLIECSVSDKGNGFGPALVNGLLAGGQRHAQPRPRAALHADHGQ